MANEFQFTRIFLDTNVLHQPWPRLSVKVENMLSAASKLGVAVDIPAAVLMELGRQWRDHISSEIDNANRILTRMGSLVGNPSLAAIIPDRDTLKAGYEKAVQTLFKTWSIESSPMPTIELAELFTQAGERSLVFGDKGANFQDAVIWHSAVEQLITTGGHGVLVSDDGIFHKRKSECESYASTKNVKITALKLDATEEHFRNLLGDADKKRIARHKALARTSVIAFLPRFEKIFNELHLNSENISVRSSTSLADAHFTEVADVDIAVREGEPPGGSEVRLSAIVRGSVVETSESVRPHDEVRTFSKRQKIEVGFTAVAQWGGENYEIKGVESVTYGWPSLEGSVGHPNFDAIAEPAE